MKSSIKIFASLGAIVLLVLGAAYGAGYFVGHITATLENDDGGNLLSILGPVFAGLLIIGSVVAFIVWRKLKNAKEIGAIWRFALLLFAGVLIGIGITVVKEGGSPFILVAMVLAGIGLCAFALRPDAGKEATALQDLLLGDMTDPRQRKIMIRSGVATLTHILTVDFLLDGSMTPIILSDGLIQAEWFTLAIIFVALASLIWLLIELKLFFTIDDYIAQVYVGPIVAALAAYVVLLLTNNIATKYFQTGGLSAYWQYMMLWFLVAGAMIYAVVKNTGDDA